MTTTDPYAPDPFLEAVARATGKVYPSGGAIRWADKLAKQYGEDRVVRALGRASKEAEPGKVLSLTEEILEHKAALAERIETKEEDDRRQQGRDDRDRRELDYQRRMQGTSGTESRRLSELMPDMPWRKEK